MDELTLIISLRCSDFAFYKKRLDLRSGLDLHNVRTILVDDGSPLSTAKEIEDLCLKRGYDYHRIAPDGQRPFSLSRARNKGLLLAESRWVCFEDADLTYESGHYQKLIKLLEDLSNTPFNFITVPAIYLNEMWTNKVFENGSVNRVAQSIIAASCLDDPTGKLENRTVESFSPATSVIAVDRKIALNIGGFNEGFEGWGGEDRDFAFRLLLANDKIQRPIEFEATKHWNLNDTCEYKGWRSLYRLMGDFAARQGMYAFHLHHERLPWRSDLSKSNIEKASKLAKFYFKTGLLEPLLNEKKPVTVILGKNPHFCNSQILGEIENHVFVDDDVVQSVELVVRKIMEYQPLRVIMWNNYGSPLRRDVCKRIRELGVETVIVERGALPNSFYFDNGGFCAESASYSEEKLPEQLSPGEMAEVKAYCAALRGGEDSLEIQAGRIGGKELRRKFAISPDKKIFFCALQMASDTTTRFFSETGREYSDFINDIKKLHEHLSDGWVLAYKNHPLSIEKLKLSSAICLDDFHINDVLEASDAVGTFNSGVGVLAMVYQKPCFYWGKCFYALEDVNRKWTDALDVARELKALRPVNADKGMRFIFHLLHNIYSFAECEYRAPRIKKNGELVNVLQSIRYDSVKFPWSRRIHFYREKRSLERSILFDVYRFSNGNSAQPENQYGQQTSSQIYSRRAPKTLSKQSIRTRKLAKLKRDPKSFFKDAKIAPLRVLAKIFNEKKSDGL